MIYRSMIIIHISATVSNYFVWVTNLVHELHILFFISLQSQVIKGLFNIVARARVSILILVDPFVTF
jgi:hypothetical protein